MSATIHTTGYARLNSWQARGVLCLLVALIVSGMAITLSSTASGFVGVQRPGPSDAELYEATARRVHAGEAYYLAMADELRQRGYPTQSIFNWRTPMPMWLIGMMPQWAMGKWLLCGLAGLLLMLAFEWLAREGGVRAAVVGTLLMTGPLMFCVLGNKFVMPVVWAGVLIGLSLCALGLGRTRLGVAAGIAAVFCRELAGPFCALMLLLAIIRRRRGEAIRWTIGLACYAIYFLYHMQQVATCMPRDGVAHGEGWLQLGGAAFVISTVQMNAYLLLSPQWVAVVVLVLSLLGFAGWHSPAAERAGLTVAAYMAMFAIIGHDFNQYWGALMAPAICLGFAWASASVRDLWQTAQMGTPLSQPLRLDQLPLDR